MFVASFVSLALAQEPAAPAPAAEPAAPAADAPVAAPTVVDRTPAANQNPCKNASACTNYETFRPCTGPTCDFVNDPKFASREVCKEGANGEFLAYCVKPKEPMKSNSGACICDSGSPRGGWVAGLLLLAVARKRRA